MKDAFNTTISNMIKGKQIRRRVRGRSQALFT